ncbi:hypothetical protein BS47DRAFT_196759 [Hydnum rufescens UP504]|uniref:Uncharacterized protein n=1 Tax=Hydnum rufescens UP504 TaxID=1448309 RepID=A0A9P6B9M7_9AGAM|nr:hypothetical protein BS47DRAFT_196759 [Hydnum rufescens UP504]
MPPRSTLLWHAFGAGLEIGVRLESGFSFFLRCLCIVWVSFRLFSCPFFARMRAYSIPLRAFVHYMFWECSRLFSHVMLPLSLALCPFPIHRLPCFTIRNLHQGKGRTRGGRASTLPALGTYTSFCVTSRRQKNRGAEKFFRGLDVPRDKRIYSTCAVRTIDSRDS